MNEQDKPKAQPSHRISFARINGKDERGQSVLGPAREIGSIWPRNGRDGEGILRFDHIPEEMRSKDGGVLFVRSLDALRKERPAPQQERKDHDQGYE